ncbi:unnamed protein product, partial [Closterium sp. NIES-53]
QGQGSQDGGSGSGGGGGVSSGGGGGSEGGGSSGSGGGSGGFGGGGGGSGGGGASGGSGSGGGRAGATQHGGSGGGKRQHQQRRSETPSPQQLREWFSQRGASGGSGSCPYVICTSDRAGQTCRKPHTEHRCFSRLDDAWRVEFGDEAERPFWAERLGIEAAALGASDSALPGTAPAEALHTFTLDLGASHCFFRNSTTLTPLFALVLVRMADPSEGPALARSSTILPCLAYRCPPGRDGHYHHSWGPVCVDLHVYTDGPPPGNVHSSAWVESVQTCYFASSCGCVCPGVCVRSGSTPLLLSPTVASDSPVAPPPGSPLPARPSWHALPPPCLWQSAGFVATHEWYTQRQRGGGTGPCTYVLRSGDRAGEQCGGAHPTQRCFGRLTDAWRQQFPGASEIPRWDELLRAGVAIFDLDFDAILAAMYVVTISEETEGYRCFQPDPGIGTAALGACEAAALGASESALSGAGETALSGTASPSSSLTFTLDSGASRSFFRDRTTLTPLGRPVAVSLADPSGGPVLSHFSTVLLCPAAPSGTLSGLYLPSFSTNLVSGADLQDAGVHQFTHASQRVTHCTDARTGRHLATFSRQPGSSLYTLTTASPPGPPSGQVAASGQVFAAASRSGPESAPCSCRLLSHETLLWHHRLGHPSLPCLRSMASRVLVSGLPRSLPPLPSGPGPSCVPCVEGRLRAAPHSSQFPPTEAPLQTLHMDVWGPAPVRGQGHERYFLLVVDDYSRYTTVLPLRSKGAVTEVLIDWIREARLQLRKSFGSDFPVLRLHSDRGGEFSSRLLRDYCRARGIRQTFTLPDSPQQNGIAERRIGMVMDVARTSMMHAAAPHFLWPFAQLKEQSQEENRGCGCDTVQQEGDKVMHKEMDEEDAGEKDGRD